MIMNEWERRKVLDKLETVWNANPGLRLGQLIGNVYHYPSGLDPYFDNDQVFIEKIEHFYNRPDESIRPRIKGV